MLFLLCIVLIFAAPITHLVWCTLKIKGLVSLPIAAITLICLVLGIILSVLATYIDIKNLPAGTICATPSIGFAFLGIAISCIIIPISTIIFYIINYYSNRKSNLDIAQSTI
jgi:uncharacterized membrane protein